MDVSLSLAPWPIHFVWIHENFQLLFKVLSFGLWALSSPSRTADILRLDCSNSSILFKFFFLVWFLPACFLFYFTLVFCTIKFISCLPEQFWAITLFSVSMQYFRILAWYISSYTHLVLLWAQSKNLIFFSLSSRNLFQREGSIVSDYVFIWSCALNVFLYFWGSNFFLLGKHLCWLIFRNGTVSVLGMQKYSWTQP